MSETNAEPDQLLELTAQIVAAHVGRNQIAADALPELIRSVHASLAGAGKPPAAARGKTAAGGAAEEVGVPRLYHLPGGREETEDAQAASADQLRPDAGAVSREMGPAPRLPDGGAKLRREARRPRQVDRPRPQAEAAQAPTPAPRKAGRQRKAAAAE